MIILSVVGARPQFVKLAPVAAALAGRCEHVIVHTGQHYDERLSAVFFTDLAIAAPDVELGVGSGPHGAQTGAMLAALEPVLQRYQPSWVLAYGDTNSTLAAAVTAVKLHLPLAHLEAGLRSHNRRMPEEHNRVLTDHAADLNLAPTATAMANLRLEGLADRSVLVGDVMTDICLSTAGAVRDGAWPGPADLAGSTPTDHPPYSVATLHRPDNTDDPRRLQLIVSALSELPRPVLLLAHPRLVACAEQHRITLQRNNIRVLPSQSYPDLVRLLLGATSLITDSGGLQKEAFLLRVPCTTIRPETEWPETLELGWNALCPDPAQLTEVDARPAPTPSDATPYGDGHAAQRVAAELLGSG